MFPITDPSRAADIRMRRRRAIWLLVGIVVVPLVLVFGRSSHSGDNGAFHIVLPNFTISSDDASQIHMALQQIPGMAKLAWMVEGATLPEGRRDGTALSASGSKLAIDLTCAQSIAVVPKSDLGGRIFASSLDGSPVQEAGLELRGGAQDKVTLGGTCRHGSTDVVVQASPSTALSITLNGGTSLRTGAFSGPVRLVQRGGGDAVIDAAGGLDVEKDGGGDLVVGSVGVVGQAGQSLHLVQRGSGDATIKAGNIDHADISIEGNGDVHFGPDAHLGGLSLVMRGGGDVAVSHLDGSANIQATGSGDVAIARIAAPNVHLSSAGSGDISIAAGSIGRLAAAMHGSGDLAVEAEIGDASVQAGPGSDVSLPHVKGHLDRSTSGE